jgi:hypothetical protein
MLSVTYEDDFRTQIHAAGLELEEFTALAHHGSRASYIAVARPVRVVCECESA